MVMVMVVVILVLVAKFLSLDSLASTSIYLQQNSPENAWVLGYIDIIGTFKAFYTEIKRVITNNLAHSIKSIHVFSLEETKENKPIPFAKTVSEYSITVV